MIWHASVLLLALATSAAAVQAQGALSTQGFGYPPGELSGAAAALGGGLAETDPLSPVNPAALSGWLRGGGYLEYAPEFRTVSGSGATDHTMTSRFPLAEIAMTAGTRTTLALSASTLLDRTWEVVQTGFDRFGSSSIPYTQEFQSAGAIEDIRLAGAVRLTNGLVLGLAGHRYTGGNDLRITRTSSDSTTASFAQSSHVGYSGSAVSAGIEVQPGAGLVMGVSGQIGGTMSATLDDSMHTRGKAPKRYGAGAVYTGVPGLILAARADWEGWSSLTPLATNGAKAVNGWDVGAGAELRGPTLLGAAMPLRVGFRRRTLPFEAADSPVRETTLSLGTEIPVAGGQSRIDLGLQRASRSAAGVAVSEHAWTFTAGVLVRP